MRWQAAFATGPFVLEPPSVFSHVDAGPPEEVIVERALSLSFIAERPAAKRDGLVARLRALIDTTNAQGCADPAGTAAQQRICGKVTIAQGARGLADGGGGSEFLQLCQELKRSHVGAHAHSPRKLARRDFEPVRMLEMSVNDTHQWNFDRHS
jgi:hypothetical protein